MREAETVLGIKSCREREDTGEPGTLKGVRPVRRGADRKVLEWQLAGRLLYLVILCHSEAEARRALDLLDTLVAERGLTLHPEKTKLVDMSLPGAGFDFLGYHFEKGTRWPRSKSRKKLKDAIRSKTRRSNGNSLAVIIEDVNRTLKGWFEYFKHSYKPTFPIIDKWVRRRLRSILRKRHGLHGISRGHDHFRWPNAYFRVHGLFSLVEAHRALVQSSRR